MTEKNTVKHAIHSDFLAGFSSDPKYILSKYFYDDNGSRIFSKISQHEDYYLTRSECSNLKKITRECLAQIDSPHIDIIELGCGDGTKAKIMIEKGLGLQFKIDYYPIDISQKALDMLSDVMPQNDHFYFKSITSDYLDGLLNATKISTNKRLVMFLGSTLGNYSRDQAAVLLKSIKNLLNKGDHFLIGLDLKKDISILSKAYNDSSGLTRAFNFNLLERMNREVGTNFNINKFLHYPVYNPTLGAMQSFLISLEDQIIHMKPGDEVFHLHAYEPIHVENSFKYSLNDIGNLSSLCGYEIVKNYVQGGGMFVSSLWRA